MAKPSQIVLSWFRANNQFNLERNNKKRTTKEKLIKKILRLGSLTLLVLYLSKNHFQMVKKSMSPMYMYKSYFLYLVNWPHFFEILHPFCRQTLPQTWNLYEPSILPAKIIDVLKNSLIFLWNLSTRKLLAIHPYQNSAKKFGKINKPKDYGWVLFEVLFQES